MFVKKQKGQVFGAAFTAAEQKAIDIEIGKQLLAADEQYRNDLDAAVLYTLAVHYGFGAKRLRAFYDAVSAEHDRMMKRYEMPNEDYVWLCKEKLKEIGVDVDAWNAERAVSK